MLWLYSKKNSGFEYIILSRITINYNYAEFMVIIVVATDIILKINASLDFPIFAFSSLSHFLVKHNLFTLRHR